ncbi:ORF188 [Saltwater crocodilepox virus]|nr:ORF188 [Saltwater crocodilepox virus]
MAGPEPEWSELRELIYDLWQVKPEDYLFTRRDAKIIRNYFIKVMDSEEDPKNLLISSKNRDNPYITSTIFTTDVNSDLYKKQLALQDVKRDTCTAGQFILKCVYYLVRLNNASNSLIVPQIFNGRNKIFIRVSRSHNPLTISHGSYTMKFRNNISELLMNGLCFTCKDKFSLKANYEINVFIQQRLFLGDEIYYSIVSGTEDVTDKVIEEAANVPMTVDISAVTFKPSTAQTKEEKLKLYVERRSLFFPMTVRGNILELTDHARSSLIGYNGGTIIASNKISYPDVLPEPENLPTIDKGLTMVVAENEGITETELAMLYQSFDEDVTEVLDKVVQVADTHENTTNANSRQDGHLETIRKILVALNAKIDRVAANRLGTIL